MTDGIKRRNVIREMQKRTIGEAQQSKGVALQGNAGRRHATAEHGNEQPSNGRARQ